MLGGCQVFTHKHQLGAVVEVNGEYLYESDLAEVTRGLHGQDSALAANQFIEDWATEILEVGEGADLADDQIEALIKDYRRSLYKYVYEKELIRRMPKQVPDSLVEAFYEQHQSMFILKEHLIKGILLTIPTDAPDIQKVRKWLLNPGDDNLELLEKYAYRYATGYELFTDEWRTANQLLLILPLANNDLIKQLKSKSQIELKDSVSTYILQVTDKRLQGEKTPIEYARPEIEAIILSEKQVGYLQQERNKLYKDAIRFKKIHFYDAVGAGFGGTSSR